jgi:hypothetical protein
MGGLTRIATGRGRLPRNPSPRLPDDGSPSRNVDAAAPDRGEPGLDRGWTGRRSVMALAMIARRALIEWSDSGTPVESARQKSPVRHQPMRRTVVVHPRRRPACEPSCVARPRTAIHMINTMMRGDDEMRRYT